MAFPTDEIQLGPRAYGVRKGTEGAVLHSTEGAGPSRQNALDTIRLQSPGGSLYNGGGSYHFIIYDGGVFLTVPYMESAGSLTGDHTPPWQTSPITGKPGVWQPASWLPNLLSPAAMADPNAYLVAICFSGKAAELSAGLYPANMIDTAARLILWIEQQPWGPDNLPVMTHADWQTNRSDPGAGVLDRVLARYSEITTDYKALYEAEKARVARLLQVIDAKNKAFDEAGLQIRQYVSAQNALFTQHIAEIRAPLASGRQIVE